MEVGSGAGFGDCTGFTAASTLFATAPLSSFTTSHSSFANGLAAYTPASGSTARTFKVHGHPRCRHAKHGARQDRYGELHLGSSVGLSRLTGTRKQQR